MAVITVTPEMSTERPEVAAAASSAARHCVRAPAPRVHAQVEERVVDADGEADQKHERPGLVRHRNEVAGPGDDSEGREDGRQGEQHRGPRGRRRPTRSRGYDVMGSDRETPLRGRDGRRERLDRTGHAELRDVERGPLRRRPGRTGSIFPAGLGYGPGISNSTSVERQGVGHPRAHVLNDIELREPGGRLATRPSVNSGVGRRERAGLWMRTLSSAGRLKPASRIQSMRPDLRPGGVRVDRLRRRPCRARR